MWVIIDESLAEHDRLLNRYRSTVAEELAHIVLHRHVIDQVDSLADFKTVQRHPQWHTMERNAKRFSMATLMPAKDVVSVAVSLYPKLVSVAGFENSEAIVKQAITSLARVFQVSSQAMSYRFNEWPVRVKDRIENAVHDRLHFL